MKPQSENHDVCPCCGRHCPADDLHCPRGKKHFEGEGGAAEHHNHHTPQIKDETAVLLLKCGHYLHHGLTENADNILSFLSDDEKNELTKLLNKCLEHWNEKGAY